MSGCFVGARAPRLEDARFLRGEGKYLDDIEIPGALHAVLLRSPVASCTIDRIDIAAALRVPGVRAVFTCQDLGGLAPELPVQLPHPALTHARTPPALARDRICFVGQPVAMVVATDRYIGEDARDLIELDLAELPAVVDLETAAGTDGPLVHADVPRNRAGRLLQRVGDPEGAFRAADLVVRERVSVERSAGMPLEARGVLARYDEATGELTVWDSTQAPHSVRSRLAAELGLREGAVRVIAPDTGGGFGTKVMLLYPEELLVPWAAMRLRTPVKWVEDRDEHFVGSNHERLQIHHIELAARRDGTVVGLRDHFLHDTGAFAYSLDVALVAAAQIAGPYRIPNVEVGFEAIYTNTVPVSPYRGCGRPQACAALELAMDALAGTVGLDRMELRRRNFIGPEEFPYVRDGLTFVDGLPVTLDSGDYPALLERTLTTIDYPGFLREQQDAHRAGRWLGFGLAAYVEATGPGPYEAARLDVDPASGAVLVSAGAATQGQSHRTTLAQVVADQLGVPLEQVRVVTGDTAAVARGAGTFASRTAVTAGNAVDVAAARVRAKALRIAAELLEVAQDDLELRGGRVIVRGAPARWVSLQEVAACADPLAEPPEPDPARPLAGPPDPAALLADNDGPGLETDGYFAPPGATWAGGVHAAIVEIDPETFEVRWLRYVCTHDCGRMLNPVVVEGQVAGGIAQGVGGALLERMEYLPDGQLQNRSFMDFLIPYATEIPHIEQQHLETLAPGNRLGVKGVGEAGAIPVPAVLVSAVRDALQPLGAAFSEAPLSPNLIHARLSAARNSR